MISIPDTSQLVPAVTHLSDGRQYYLFPSSNTDLVKVDLIHEAGTAFQPQFLCAGAVNRLYTVASSDMDTRTLAEFMDYRGIVVDHGVDVFTATTTFYFLRKYLDELLPVIDALLSRPAFPQSDVDIFCLKRKQELQAAFMKSNEMARRLFYQSLFGEDHPMGRYALPEDAEKLTRGVLESWFDKRYTEMDMVVSGNVEGADFGMLTPRIKQVSDTPLPVLPAPSVASVSSRQTYPIAGAVQTTLRIGRVLPLRWDDPDYADFMLLTMLLGGYFGSRLMSNLREDKGYTYGIGARTQIYRGAIIFYITTDVAAGVADAAEDEIRHELQQLCDSPVGDDELELVKMVMAGDFIRSVDGVFERAERFCSMLSTQVSEVFTDNLRQSLQTATPDRLQLLAQRFLHPDMMHYCRAGAIS